MPPNRESNYNVIVIGAGAGGLVTAAGTNRLGGRVALIERRLMGGDCLNYGCVPSKALIASAQAVHTIRHADRFGLEAREPAFDFNAVFDRMRQRRARIAPADSQDRFEALGVDVFHNDARLLSPHEVDVGQGTTLKAANIVIATGTRPAAPPIDGLDEVPYYTNESIFDELHDQPKHLAIIGGGPVGCELGQMFQRLGSQVTIIEMSDRLLGKEDADVSAFVHERLTEEGLTIRCSTQVTAARARNGHMITLTLGRSDQREPAGAGNGPTLEADALLVAAGRTPNVESLNLEAVGIRTEPHGVVVNEYLQTTEPNVFAVGDVTGHPAFTHAADAEARVVVRNILTPWLKKKFDPDAVPRATFTDPEVGTVGLTEATARARGVDYDVYEQTLDDLDRAVVSDHPAGFVKVLTARGKPQVIGATLVAPHASELMHEFALAIRHGLGLPDLAECVHAYPTLSEMVDKLGDQYNHTRLTPRTKKVLAWLYRRARRRVPE